MQSIFRLVAVAIIVIALFCSPVAGQTVILRVDGDNGLLNPTGNPPAQTWNNAFLYLQDALSTASVLLAGQQATAVDIWIKGDTAEPYRPNQSADGQSAPDFSQSFGSFTGPASISGSWDECGAYIEFVPWIGTGMGGSAVGFESIIPETPCGELVLINPNNDINPQLDNGLWDGNAVYPPSTPLGNLINESLDGNFINNNYCIIRNCLVQQNEGGDPSAIKNVEGLQVAFRNVTFEATKYAFIGVNCPLGGLSCVNVNFQRIAEDEEGQATFRLQDSSTHNTHLVVFGGKSEGPSAHSNQCARIHGIPRVAYAYHTFTETEHWLGTYPGDDVLPEDYRVEKALYYRCIFTAQDTGPISLGSAGTSAGTEAWFIECTFEGSPVTNQGSKSHFLNCTFTEDPTNNSGTVNNTGQKYLHDASFVIPANVTLHGGFAGGETTLDQRNALNSCIDSPTGCIETILSGELAHQFEHSDDLWPFEDQSLHVIKGSGLTNTTELSRLIVTGGDADTSGSNGDVGGEFVVRAALFSGRFFHGGWKRIRV